MDVNGSRTMEIPKEWTMTNEDVMAMFDADGSLRDEAELQRLKNIDAESGGMRRDWRSMRDVARRGNVAAMDQSVRGNWPLESRRYEGPESLEYEGKMRRIKRQFLGIKPGSTDTSVEIIGDLHHDQSLRRFHPITLKGERKVNTAKGVQREKVKSKAVKGSAVKSKVVKKPTGKRLIDYKKRNGRTVMTEIEDLLENEMEEEGDVDADKFEDLKSRIYAIIWRKVVAKFKGAESKIDAKSLRSLVGRLFPGVYAVL